MSDPRHLSIILVPEDGRESRTFRVSHRRLRVLAAAAVATAALLALMVGSWWYLAVRAARVGVLEAEVAEFREERLRLEAFATQLDELERRYEQIRLLFGSESTQVASDLWLPPPTAGRSRRGPAEAEPPGSLPTSWPLTQRGFVTQGLLEGEEGEHPGLDIAVPTGSYIRGAGEGIVVDAAEDPVYGRYVIIDHGDGYRSLYAHASETLVVAGQQVRRNEVIALSGSTGRSTAPHLHFEILLNGEALDPLTLVRQPS